jgi:branched-chain amino acid aminotransferase
MRLPAPDAPGWLDGRPMSAGEMHVSLTDPALHVGLSVFETLAVRRGRVLDLPPHLDRLERSASRLRVVLPPRERIESTAREAARAETTGCGWLKILVTRGGRWAVLIGPMSPEEEGRAISAVLLPWRRDPRDALSGVKSTSYAHLELGLEEAWRRGADEGLWRNSRGHLAEGSSSNLFVVVRRTVRTPALREGVLAGVVRDLAIRASRELGYPVHETRVRVPTLVRAHEAFVTSSLCGVRPLVRFEGRPVGDGSPGRVTGQVAEAVVRLREGGSV